MYNFFRRGAEEEVRQEEETSAETSGISDAAKSKTQSVAATDKHPFPAQVLRHRCYLVDIERRQILDRNQEKSPFQGYLL